MAGKGFRESGRAQLDSATVRQPALQRLGGGRTQGDLVAIEAAVKDRQRFAETGWGYFTFNSPSGLVDAAAPLPTSAPCYACHKNNTAVDNTFVQFYPTLFDVAKRFGTVKPTYDPNHKP